jgi:hypothetical protein
MCRARPPLSDVSVRTPGGVALKIQMRAADEMSVDTRAHTTGGRA